MPFYPVDVLFRRSAEAHSLEARLIHFQEIYDHIEAFFSKERATLKDITEAVFKDLKPKINKSAFAGYNRSAELIEIYRGAALSIVNHIDSGDDGTSRNPFHNRLHVAETMVGFRALATIYNQQVLVEPNAIILEDVDIAKGLLAMAAHDLGHTGGTNIIRDLKTGKRKHIPYRLEDKSIKLARAWASVSANNARDIDDSLRLIRATDLSGAPSPASTIRAWHDHATKGTVRPKIPPVLRDIILCDTDRLIACFVQDADILASVITEKQAERERQRLAAEQKRDVTPKGELYFLEQMLQGRMTTDVARHLADQNITARIKEFRAQLKIAV